MDNDSSIRAVERALDVLNCFRADKLELTLTEIAREIGLARSTTSRILNTLEKKNYLARNEESQKYYLGSKLALLGSLCFSHMDFRKIALPYMIELRDYFNESISIYVVEGNYRVCVERVESNHRLRRVINIGDRLPLSRGPAGRLLLAYQEKEKIRRIIEEDPYTTEAELMEVIRAGYSFGIGEREEGVTSISTPLFNAKKQVIAAFTMSGPTARFPESCIPERIEKMKEFAEKISFDLGYQP